MASEALDEALALARTPGLREGVRQRLLPAGIDDLIQLATAPQPLLRQLAGRRGRGESEILDAVRFYLQQALFEGEPDAYRVLGVEADAAIERIHQNYRRLQRWVHPDRGDDWQSVYAARLNWAWSQLRNPAARQRYDSGRVAATTSSAASGVPEHGRTAAPRAATWTAIPVVAPRTAGWYAKRGALAVAVVVCAGLTWLAATRGRAPMRESQTLSGAAAVANGPASRVTATDTAMPALPPPIATRSLVATTPEPRIEFEPTPPSDLKLVAARAVPAVFAHRPSVAGAAAVARVHAAAAARPPTSHTVPTQLAQATAADGRSRAAPPAIARVTRSATKHASRPAPAERGATMRSAAGERAASAKTVARVVASGGSNAISAAAAGDNRAASASPARSPAAVAETATDKSLADAALLERIGVARHRVRDLVAYFRRVDHAAPGWSDAPAPNDATDARRALRDRLGLTVAARFALRSQHWHVTDRAADLDAAYRIADGPRVAERGAFHVEMTWRDDTWRLVKVELEPAR